MFREAVVPQGTSFVASSLNETSAGSFFCKLEPAEVCPCVMNHARSFCFGSSLSATFFAATSAVLACLPVCRFLASWTVAMHPFACRFLLGGHTLALSLGHSALMVVAFLAVARTTAALMSATSVPSASGVRFWLLQPFG